MQKIIPGIVLFLVIVTAQVFPQRQANSPIKVDSVLIYGNEKTEDRVILREIPFQFPAHLEMADFQLIKNRLTNLFLFNRVALGITRQGQKKLLLIQVTESWYIYPVPIFFVNERDWDKLSYGFQVSHFNFRGMNEKLSIGGWLGYNPSFFIHYNNPWVGKKLKLILGFNLFGKKVSNRFFDFDERHLGGRITLGKRFDLYNSVESSLSFRRVKLPEDYQFLSVSGNRTDYVPKISLQYKNDHRDLYEYPRKGYYIRWQLTRSGFTDNQPQFWRWEFDHRLYIKLSERLSVAGRNLLRLNDGDLPIYDRIFIGYGERIRGYFNRRFTAQNLTMHNYEARISIVPIDYFSWNNAPIGASYLQDLKYGLSLALFMDSGMVWDRTEEIALNNHFTGYGVGLDFHVPYFYLLRVEHAWNDNGQREWIIEAGFGF